MHHVERVELEVVVLIEPCTDEVIESQTGAPGERKRIDHQLRDGPLVVGARLVVEDMDRAVANLQDIDVARERDIDFDRDARTR